MRRIGLALIALASAALAVVVGAQALARVPGGSGSSMGIVFERDGDLYAIGVDDRRTLRLTNTRGWREEHPEVSPDGRWIAYTRRRGGADATLWVRSIDGRSSKRLSSREAWDPAWSPDSRTIYFSRSLHQADKGTNFQYSESCGAIFRIGIDGSGERRLTNPPWKDSFHSHFAPSVSPDGLRIAFTDANQCSGGTTSLALRVINTTGQTTTDLGRLPGNGYYPALPDYGAPAWSPDGGRIAFYGEPPLALYLAHRDGHGRRRLTPTAMDTAWPESESPAWSPDGKWFAFATSDNNHDLYLVRPDGTGLLRLTHTEASESAPSWIGRMIGK